jgi:hypothetical protein
VAEGVNTGHERAARVKLVEHALTRTFHSAAHNSHTARKLFTTGYLSAVNVLLRQPTGICLRRRPDLLPVLLGRLGTQLPRVASAVDHANSPVTAGNVVHSFLEIGLIWRVLCSTFSRHTRRTLILTRRTSLLIHGIYILLTVKFMTHLYVFIIFARRQYHRFIIPLFIDMNDIFQHLNQLQSDT